MSGFALLWSKILLSSLWIKESKETRLVWITLLAMKNSEGIIQSSVVGLADQAKVSVPECKEALRVLLSPDEDDTSGVEDGRRIMAIPGGWQIVNHDKYRFSTEAKREFWREQKRQQREKQAREASRPKRRIKPVQTTLHERLTIKAQGDGDDAELSRLNAIQAATDGAKTEKGLSANDGSGIPMELQ